MALLCPLLTLLLAGCLGDAGDDGPDDCARLRDHSIELSLRAANEVGGAGLSEEMVAAHKAQLIAALGAEYQARCDQLTPHQLDCALGATSSEALDACTGGSR